MTTPRAIVNKVFLRKEFEQIWTSNYEKVLPITCNGFELSAILPAVFYMLRFGHRRGRGTFLKTFSIENGTERERRRAATIKRISKILANEDSFRNFSGDAEEAILGDLLLCYCLENVRYKLGREEQVQRVAPAHYMSSWVDLPESVAHLRFVPEMIVAMLVNQMSGDVIDSPSKNRIWFPIGSDDGHKTNLLLRAFNEGIELDGRVGDLTSDQFDEINETVSLGQLLMIRLAQQLGRAPHKLRGKSGSDISNQRPIANVAASNFSDDIRRFIRSYFEVIPRYAFIDLLESCVSIGITTIVTSVVQILSDWVESGKVLSNMEQKPATIFVDCSNGVDKRLKLIAEKSFDEFMREIEHFPVILMGLRLLDCQAEYDRKIRSQNIQTTPYATEWINMLGDILHGHYEDSGNFHWHYEGKSEQLAEELENEYPEEAQILRSVESEPNAVWRLAEALTSLQGPYARQNVTKMLDSALMTGRPNGLAVKRKGVRSTTGKKQGEIRSIVLTNSVLDYLVHLNVLKPGNKKGTKPLSFNSFIQSIYSRHGLCVDIVPDGIQVSNELLQKNRAFLEHRLRDLGLLVGVNDAESMKRLQPRFISVVEKLQ